MKKRGRNNIGLISILLSLIPWGFFFAFFRTQTFSSNSADWGDFGSYIGGTVAALTVPLTAFLLIKTYKSQQLKQLI